MSGKKIFIAIDCLDGQDLAKFLASVPEDDSMTPIPLAFTVSSDLLVAANQ